VVIVIFHSETIIRLRVMMVLLRKIISHQGLIRSIELNNNNNLSILHYKMVIIIWSIIINTIITNNINSSPKNTTNMAAKAMGPIITNNNLGEK
jgi:hypothetical protein